mmetsp:Transcript_2152/g.6231  ORF Transcript_2152/g.6231 Transcript_2152/m.6231 type:complete len:250 (-) Transcript_2152:1476-2225(-)
MVRVGHHEPLRLHFGFAEVHEIGSTAVLPADGHDGHLVVVISRLDVGREHDHDLGEGMVLPIDGGEQVLGTVKEPLGDDEGDTDLDGIPRGVQLGTVNNILRSKMARNQVRSGVVVNDLGIFEGVLVFVHICPLHEHGCIVGQRNVLTLLVEHNLRSEGRDDLQSTFHPHLRHSIIVGDGIVGAGSLDLELTDETLHERVRCVVDCVTIGVMEKGDGNLFVELIPLVSVILRSKDGKGSVNLDLGQDDV